MKPSNKIASELSSLYLLLYDREEQLGPSNWLVVERFNLRTLFPGLLGAFARNTSVPVIQKSVADALTPEIKSHPGYVWLKLADCGHGNPVLRRLATRIHAR